MATCRDIVSRALRMARVVDREDDPTAAELRDGLIVLQNLYDQWLIGGMFGRLTDVYDAGDYEAEEGQRIFTDGAVTLPSEIDERKPRDLVAVEYTDVDGHRAYIWDRNAWVRIDSLADSDAAPLAGRGENGLAACVALLFADEFGAQITSGIARQAGQFKSALFYKAGSEQELVPGAWY